MKKFITPILVIIGFFALMYAALASTDRTTTIALVGAGYSVLLVAIFYITFFNILQQKALRLACQEPSVCVQSFS